MLSIKLHNSCKSFVDFDFFLSFMSSLIVCFHVTFFILTSCHISRRLIKITMEKLRTQHGGITTTSMNISGSIFVVLAVLFLGASIDFWEHILSAHSLCIYRSPSCFELGWPMRVGSPFLKKPMKRKKVSL